MGLCCSCCSREDDAGDPSMFSRSPVTGGELLLAIDDDENQLRMFSSRFGAATGAVVCAPPPPPPTSPWLDVDGDKSTRPYCWCAWCGDCCSCGGDVVDEGMAMLLLLFAGGMLLMFSVALLFSVISAANPTRSSSMSSGRWSPYQTKRPTDRQKHKRKSPENKGGKTEKEKSKPNQKNKGD